MSNRATWEYYEKRSVQRPRGVSYSVPYWQGLGVPCTPEEVVAEEEAVARLLGSLPPGSFLDVGCGPGTYTGMLRGPGVAIDQSAGALARVAAGGSSAAPVRGDAMSLPFVGDSFDRALVAHLYGLLQPDEAQRLLQEVSRVAHQVLILDAGRPEGVAAQEWQERVLPDGSRHRVFRRHFLAEELAREVGGEILFAGSFYVVIGVAGPSGRAAPSGDRSE